MTDSAGELHLESESLWAHSPGREGDPPQTLEEHARNVSRLAEGFATPFQAGAFGRLAGLWHDLGKCRPGFQAYIRDQGSSVEHAIGGALLAWTKGNKRDPSLFLASLALAFVIEGHHGGLANFAKGERTLPAKLRQKKRIFEEIHRHAPAPLLDLELPSLPERLRHQPGGRSARADGARAFEFWTRFLFSALVDADFLDTEHFYRGGERRSVVRGFESIAVLREKLDAHIDALAGRAAASEVNALRADVLRACREKAERPPGIFSLTVPTGGGKTLAAMAFALRHAERHELRRVIAVAPFTSIIDQNAAVYRQALGEENVIEHHSNLDPARATRRNKLASENWDAPVIVTTGVQFFESLFANRPSRCRKLHNIARSVVLLDEVQTLPPKFLIDLLDALRELSEHYGATIVFTTATQPAFAHQPEHFAWGLRNIEEIVPDPKALAGRLRRYRVEWPTVDAEPTAWADLAQELGEHDQVLAVVHRRDDARQLAELLPEAGCFHLSALMCAAHRKERLAEVKAALRGGAVCRLVSTQLIEAGVDIDFPVVYRALGGLDSLAQAAGRCNREGRLHLGRFKVFRAPTSPPPGLPRVGLETVESLLALHGKALEPADPDQVEEYFRMVYNKLVQDARGVHTERQELNFQNVAAKVRLIDDFTQPLVVPHGDAEARLDQLRTNGPNRDTLRALQPFVVNLPAWVLDQLIADVAVEVVGDTVYALHKSYAHLYEEKYGLRLEGPILADPVKLID